jgi:HPt (histidine-containing phosphotransfer) domain-containing protein
LEREIGPEVSIGLVRSQEAQTLLTKGCEEAIPAVDLLDYDRLDGASARVLSIIERFAEGLPAALEALRNALSTAEIDSVARLAHKLKGSSGSCGFAGVMREAQGVETLARNNAKEEALRVGVEKLATATVASIAEFRRWNESRSEAQSVGSTGANSHGATI